MNLSVVLHLLNFFHEATPLEVEAKSIGNKSSEGEVSPTTLSFPSVGASILPDYSLPPSPPSLGTTFEYRTSTEALWNHKNDENQETEDCRGVYGCFPISEPWEGPERPVSIPPKTLEEIKPFFCLHSPQQPECWKFFSDETLDLKMLTFPPKTQLIVVTHGFLLSIETPWVKDMVAALLENIEGNLRILTLDWQRGATPPYAQAVANTRLMGALVGRLIERLVKEAGLKLPHIHLVGHSLGAHIFGYAGSYVIRAKVGRIGRITGMDPAGPYFRDTPPQVRLDPSDAYLVDIIHTSLTPMIPSLPVSLGYPESSGHLDFFPNGGGEQKGCGKSAYAHIVAQNDLGDGVFEFVSCSHESSHRYLTATLAQRCSYIGVECSSWKTFKQGGCWDCKKQRCFRMGFDLERVYPLSNDGRHVPPNRREDFYGLVERGETKLNLYLTTAKTDNFCGEQLRFTLVLSNTEKAKKQGGEYAKLKVVVRGENGSAEASPHSESVYLRPGEQLVWVDAIPSSMGDIHSIVVTFEEEPNFLLNPGFFRITSPAIYLEEIRVERLLRPSKKKSLKACRERVMSGEMVVFGGRCVTLTEHSMSNATSSPATLMGLV